MGKWWRDPKCPIQNLIKTMARRKPNTLEQAIAIQEATRSVASYDRSAQREQRIIVEKLMVEGAGCAQITRVLREITYKDNGKETGIKKWPRISDRIVKKRMEEVRDSRKKDASLAPKEEIAEMRSLMVERLTNLRQQAMVEKNYKTVINCEREIAKLKGLYAPTDVKIEGTVQHNHAMLTVIAGMDPEQAQELLNAGHEQRQLADKARRFLPAITVEATSDGE